MKNLPHSGRHRLSLPKPWYGLTSFLQGPRNNVTRRLGILFISNVILILARHTVIQGILSQQPSIFGRMLRDLGCSIRNSRG